MNTEVMTSGWCWRKDMEMLTFDAAPPILLLSSHTTFRRFSEYPPSNQELPELLRVFIPKYLQALATYHDTCVTGDRPLVVARANSP